MHPDVHSAALRAAAKVAFSAAFLGACSGATAEAPAPTSGSEANEGTATTDVVTPPGNDPTTPRPRGDAGKDASARDASADGATDGGPSNCEAVVASTFASVPPHDFPGVAKTLSGEQSACCVERLEATQGLDMEHRFDCCASLEHTTPGSTFGSVSAACTPWGPPVPPPMVARRRVRADRVAIHV